jgi:hypothetical protein
MYLSVLLATALDAAAVRAQPALADEEIVVTAQRAGAPVWRVRTPTGTLVLVGSIDNIAAGTDWRPAALAKTVAQAHRVMFPQMIGISLSPFSLVSYYAKWKRRARLPEGQTLSGMMSKVDFSRLADLAARGLAPADFNRWHPLHLSFNMQDRLRKQTGLMEEPTATVSRAASKLKVRKLPIQRASARPLADTLFRSQPIEHLRCLTTTIAAVESGPEGLRQRSQDWAGKKVRAALAAPSQGIGKACWPTSMNAPDPSHLAGMARQSLGTFGTTLAVVSLDALARSGGLLDTLRSEGFQVDGPTWR